MVEALARKIRAPPVTKVRATPVTWVAAYRRLRQRAKLPPREAAEGATLEVFGPLPF